MRTILTITLAIWAAQLAGVAQKTSQKGPDQAELLQKLRSQNISERSDAYEKLRGDSPENLSPAVKAAFIDLLDRENRETMSGSTINDEDEGYVEYVSDLIGNVKELVDWTNPRQVCVLVSSAYPPQAEIASHPTNGMSCLIQKAESKHASSRGEAVAMLVQVLAHRSNGLDSAMTQTVRQIILGALHDPEATVRIYAVKALGRFGGSDMIPPLMQVAATDPDPSEHYAIRKWSTEAMTAIQKRDAQN
jgi:hypothetical protein